MPEHTQHPMQCCCKHGTDQLRKDVEDIFTEIYVDLEPIDSSQTVNTLLYELDELRLNVTRIAMDQWFLVVFEDEEGNTHSVQADDFTDALRYMFKWARERQ